MKYRVLDLFAGAGGMSDGFMQTEKFIIVAAVEKNLDAKNTYINNHPGLILKDDICEIDFEALLKEVGTIDVIIGGPPCQGFSNANRQKNHIISGNNQLVKRYVDAVLKIKPRAFVMENVGMLRSETHRFFVTHSEGETINQYKIKLKEESITIALSEVLADYLSYGNPTVEQYKSLLFGADEFAIVNLLYKNTCDEERMKKYISEHKVKCQKYITQLIVKYSNNENKVLTVFHENLLIVKECVDGTLDLETIYKALKELIDIQEALRIIIELYKNDVDFKTELHRDHMKIHAQSYSVISYLTATLGSNYYVAKGIINAADYGVPQQRKRYILMGMLKKLVTKEKITLPEPIKNINQYTKIRDAIKDLEQEPTCFEVSQPGKPRTNILRNMTKYQTYVCNSNTINNHVITATREVALRRFTILKPGQNFHDLSEEIKLETYSNIGRTQNTIYKRLDYDSVSGTVLNVRKSMWIHPVLNRAISIREAARLQSFRDSFVFFGNKDSQYQQVGNAVPPLMARAIAEKILELLGDVPKQFLSEII